MRCLQQGSEVQPQTTNINNDTVRTDGTDESSALWVLGKGCWWTLQEHERLPFLRALCFWKEAANSTGPGGGRCMFAYHQTAWDGM